MEHNQHLAFMMHCGWDSHFPTSLTCQNLSMHFPHQPICAKERKMQGLQMKK
jgi:hypothetical protein